MPTVLEILALIAKEFGIAAAETLLTVLQHGLESYNPEATYNHDAPHVIAHLIQWQEERGVKAK